MKPIDSLFSVIRSHPNILIFILGISLVAVLVLWAVILLSRGFPLPLPQYRPNYWLA